MYVRPDGGWGWIVALGAFLNGVIVDGVKYSFGIIFVELVDTFKRSKSETSWIMSIQIGVMLLSGPVVAALVNRFGCRKIALVGTVVSFSGFIASAFVHSLYVMYLTFGVLGGFGFGMMTMPAMVTLSRYFDKRLALASGIAAMGSGFGTLVFNPLSKVLIDEYTWRGTLLIEAGIVLNGVVCALIMKQPENLPEDTYVSEEHDTDYENDEVVTEQNNAYHTSSKRCADNQECARNYEAEADKSNMVKLLTDYEEIDTSKSNALAKDNAIEMSYSLKESNIEQLNETDPGAVRPLLSTIDENIPTFLTGVVHTESNCQTCREISLEIGKNGDTKIVAINERHNKHPIELEKTTPGIANDIKSTHRGQDIVRKANKKRWFSLSPLKNVGFLFFLASGFLIEVALNVPFTFLPDMMLHKGFHKQDAVWMLFIIGLVSTISRIVIGIIADLKFVNRVKLCNSVVVLNGIIVMLCPFCNNYASFLAFSVFFGFSAGSSSSLRYVLVPDLFGVDMIADFYGINMFFCAFAAFVGLPKAGALLDATGNYMVPFVTAGVELALSGLLLFLIPTVQKLCMTSRARDAHSKQM